MVIELELVASTDRLTGAWNRRRLEESVRSEMERMARYGHSLCLLLIDVDRFKPINDQYGHAVGDAVLQRLTALLQAALRKVDSLSRWGGEEFVVLCPNTARATAAAVAERLRREVATAHFATVGSVTVSIGVAECATGESWEEWFARADAALYRAKSEGRNQVRVAPELAGQSAQRRLRGRQLRAARLARRHTNAATRSSIAATASSLPTPTACWRRCSPTSRRNSSARSSTSC
jgi:diguanylate cyclase (GGDEF)-like protein